MSLKSRLLSTLVSLTIATGAIAGSAQSSSAASLTPAEAAALAGVGGFVLGAAVSSYNSGPYYEPHHYPRAHRHSAWERHVDRCLDRYRSYDPRSDTYLGYDGYRHYCRL